MCKVTPRRIRASNVGSAAQNGPGNIYRYQNVLWCAWNGTWNRSGHFSQEPRQQLAAVRMLFDWLIIGQVVPVNPASAVRGPKHVMKIGTTPVLDGKEGRQLIDAIPTGTLHDLGGRALIATLTYSFAWIGAALKMKAEADQMGLGGSGGCTRKVASTIS